MPLLSSHAEKDFNSRPSARGDTAVTDAQAAVDEFQFTPLREGRLCGTSSVRAVIHFNSRPSARGDTECHTMAQADFISIHAPPRGATMSRKSRRTRTAFQFTPLREGRRCHTRTRQRRKAFQFTPLREGRPAVLCRLVAIRIFQFTPLREGRRDNRQGHRAAGQPISIHAPPRGATGLAAAENDSI